VEKNNDIIYSETSPMDYNLNKTKKRSARTNRSRNSYSRNEPYSRSETETSPKNL